jgi:hypothetical protein
MVVAAADEGYSLKEKSNHKCSKFVSVLYNFPIFGYPFSSLFKMKAILALTFCFSLPRFQLFRN